MCLEYVETLTAYTINSGATESYSYAGNQRLSRNNIWDEAQGVRCNQTSYYLYDGRESVTANTWYNGMVTDVYQYDPYGQVELGSTKHTDFYGYNAESYNPNSGLEYLRARYYNANQGRFFQEDTYLGDIIDPLTLNRYVYVKNSPMNYVDPSGHEAFRNPNNPASVDYKVPSAREVLESNNVESGVEWLTNLITNGRRYLKEQIEESSKSGMIKDCHILQRGIKFGMDDFWMHVEKYTLGKAFLLFGSEKYYHSDEEFQAAYAESLRETMLEIKDMGGTFSLHFDLDTYETGINIGYRLALLSLIEGLSVVLSGFGGGSTRTQVAYVRDSAGGLHQVEITVPSTGEIEKGIGATIIIQQMTGSDDEGEADSKLPNQGTVKGDVENAPSVDAGKQGKHVQGHPNYKEGNSTWQPGNNGVHDTQEAWVNGTELPDGTKVWDTGNTVGTNGETGVRVHIDGKGNIHGYPVDPGRYLPD